MAKQTTVPHTFVFSLFFFFRVFKVISRVHQNETFFIHFLVCSPQLSRRLNEFVRFFLLSFLNSSCMPSVECAPLEAIYSQEYENVNKFTINFNCILSVSTNFHGNLDHHQLQQQQQQNHPWRCRIEQCSNGKDHDDFVSLCSLTTHTASKRSIFTWFFNIQRQNDKGHDAIHLISFTHSLTLTPTPCDRSIRIVSVSEWEWARRLCNVRVWTPVASSQSRTSLLSRD